jgi:hypothetical protein
MANMFRARRSMLVGAGAIAGYFARTPAAALAANPAPDDAPANATGKMMNVEQALDVLYFGAANVRNPKFAGGAKGGGVGDDTAAFEAALATGKRVYVPAGSYNISRTLTVPQPGGLVGDGMTQSILNSKVIAGSLITTAAPDGAQNSLIQDLQLNGNGLTGANGNGHALNFIDPVLDAGAWAPQGMVVQRLWIRNFRGNESRNHVNAPIMAAGVICVQGLQNVFRDIIVHNCGHGFYLDSTQTNKLVNCVAYLCDKAGIFTYKTVGTLIEQCDIVGNGSSGTTDAAYPASDLGMANIIASFDENLTISRTKVKNTNGQAQLYLKQCYGTVISENWIRSDIDRARAIVVNNGIKALNCPGLKIKDNTFSCVLAAGTVGQPVKAKHVNLVTPSRVEGFSFTFTGNAFVTQPGLLTEYSLCVESTGGFTNCEFSGCIIDGNRFGTPLAVRSAITHDDGILVRNCSFTYSRITNNVFYAQANVTRKRGVSGRNLSAYNNLVIGDNLFKQDGGKISDNYDGLLYPTRRFGRGTFASPRLAPGAITTTTLPVSSAVPGEPVQAFFSAPVPSVILSAWVSEAGTVTVQAFNPTQAALNLGSANVGVIVSRMSDAEAE